jgi:rubrerythrin
LIEARAAGIMGALREDAMDKTKMFLMAVRLEQRAAACYAKLGRLALPEGTVAGEIDKLSREELVHADLLKRGEQYVLADAGLFKEGTLTEDDLAAYLGLAEKLERELDEKGLTLAQGLAVIRDLEALMEKAHLATLLDVIDPPTKKLFQALTEGDRKHRERLEGILELLRIEPGPRV